MAATADPQLQQITTLLGRIRTRLFAVRLIERVSVLALTGGVVAAVLVLSLVLRALFPVLSILLALTPALAVGAAIWSHRHGRWAWAGRFPRALYLPGAVLLGVSTVAMLIVLIGGLWRHGAAWQVAAACVGLWLLGGLLTARRAALPKVAQFVDKQAKLAERVSTAYEWATEENLPTNELDVAFRAPLLASAVQACTEVRRAKIGYSRLDRRVYAGLALSLAVAGAACLIPPLPPMVSGQHVGPTIQQIVKATEVEKALAEFQKKHHLETDPSVQKQIEGIRTIATDLRDGNLNNLQAQMRLAEAKSQLQAMQEQQEAAQQAQQALQNGGAYAKDLAAAAQALKDAGQGQQGSQSAQQQAQAQLDAAGQKAAAALGGMSGSEKAALQKQFDAAAKAAAGNSQLRNALAGAAAAAGAGDAAGLKKNMDEAGKEMAAAGQQREQTGSQLKDALAAASAAGAALQGEQNQAGQQGASGQQGSGNEGSSGQQLASAGDMGSMGQQGVGQSGQQGQQDGQGGQQGQEGGQQGGQQAGQQGGQQGQQGGQQGQSAQSGSQGGESGQSGQQDGQQGAGHQAGQGDGQQSAAGGGQGGQGSGQAASGGSGSTNFEQPGGPGGKFQGHQVGGIGQYAKIYGAETVANSGAKERLQGGLNPNGKSAGTVQVMGAADKDDHTMIDYSKQLPAARQLAEDAMDKQQIPPQYRDLVRAYYDVK